MERTINTLMVTFIMIMQLIHYYKLPKTGAYVKSYDRQTKWMYFLTEYDDLLETFNTIWDKVTADIKKNIVSLSTIKNF